MSNEKSNLGSQTVSRLHISKGNGKLHRSVGIFNLPVCRTCPAAGACRWFCYAMKAEKWPSVLQSRLDNFHESLKDSFVAGVVDWISRSDVKTFKMHEAGDLYNQKYVNKWAQIASQCPDVTFFLYTKSLHLDLSPLTILQNVCVVNSYGGMFDQRIDKATDNYAKVIENVHDVQPGEYLCPGVAHSTTETEKICGNLCTYCLGRTASGKKHKVRVCFVKHMAGWNGPWNPTPIPRSPANRPP